MHQLIPLLACPITLPEQPLPDDPILVAIIIALRCLRSPLFAPAAIFLSRRLLVAGIRNLRKGGRD